MVNWAALGKKIGEGTAKLKQAREAKKQQAAQQSQQQAQYQQQYQQQQPQQNISATVRTSRPGMSIFSKLALFAILIMILKIIFFPFVLVYNFARTGKFFPNGTGGIPTMIIIFLVFAVIGLVLYPIIAPIGFSGVRAEFANLFGTARDTAEQVSGAYIQNVQQAMGLSYASDIDKYADEDIGVSMRDVRTTQNHYTRSDAVSIWGSIDGKSMSPERSISASFECWHEQRLDSGVERIDGIIQPSASLLIDREISREFRCEFPQGVLANDGQSAPPGRFNVRTTFDFTTMSYITFNFMDADAFYTLERTDPTRTQPLKREPRAQNTYAPIEIGMGSQSHPILISDESLQLMPTIGFSLSNKWSGFVRNLTGFHVRVPKGISIKDCDAMIDLVHIEDSSDEFFENYTLAEDSLDHISSRITSNDGARRFVPQSFNCFLNIDPSVIFQNRNRLDPVSLNIFATVEYEYMFVEDFSVRIVDDQDSIRFDYDPSRVYLTSSLEFSISETGLNRELQAARYTLRHRKRGEISSEVLENFQNQQMFKNSEGAFIANIGRSQGLTLEQVIPDLEKDDVLIIEFNVVKSNGEPARILRAIRILNNPPQVESIKIEPLMPGVNDTIECIVEAIDEDGDDIEEAIFLFRNMNQYTREEKSTSVEADGVDCNEQGNIWICTAQTTLEADAGDVIECSISLYDGITYNRQADRTEVTIVEEQVAATGIEAPEVPCESTDGFNVERRGTTKGIGRDGEFRTVTDYCEENDLLEYYCDSDGYVSYRLIENCNCNAGRCWY